MIPPALAERLADGRRITFSEYVEVALYDPVDGFYASGGRAGGAGDFLTSPEVGPLYGALLARWLDDLWTLLGRPDPFVVVEAGAGPGTLARSIRVAEPTCAVALVYVLVERSDRQRTLHAEHLPGWVGERSGATLEELVAAPLAGSGPVFASASEPPTGWVGAAVANELLDNLPFDVVRRVGADAEQMLVSFAEDGALEAEPAPAPAEVATLLAELGVPDGAWVPRQGRAHDWVADVRARLGAGRLLVVDYGGHSSRLANMATMGWLRTYRRHAVGDHPLEAPGTQDITSDLDVDQLQRGQPASRVRRQAAFLHDLGLDALVDEGRRIWAERAHAPDVAALRARSRVREAEALTDPEGLGAFWALEWDIALRAPG